jgi:hypothetical protein
MKIEKTQDGILLSPSPGEEISEIKSRVPYGLIFYLNTRYKLNLPIIKDEPIKKYTVTIYDPTHEKTSE